MFIARTLEEGGGLHRVIASPHVATDKSTVIGKHAHVRTHARSPDGVKERCECWQLRHTSTVERTDNTKKHGNHHGYHRSSPNTTRERNGEREGRRCTRGSEPRSRGTLRRQGRRDGTACQRRGPLAEPQEGRRWHQQSERKQTQEGRKKNRERRCSARPDCIFVRLRAPRQQSSTLHTHTHSNTRTHTNHFRVS